MRHILIALTLLVLHAASSDAQLRRPTPDTTVHVLQLPVGQRMLCRQLGDRPDSIRTNGATQWQFLIGAPRDASVPLPPRDVQVLFDRVGHPLALLDRTHLFPIHAEQVVVRFTDSTVSGERTDARFDSAAVARMDSAIRHGKGDSVQAAVRNVVPQSVPRPMTATEYEQARALSAWLWEHRCRRG